MKNLYALLVGINTYKPPNTPLYGCVKDVHRIEDYLKRFHGDEYDLRIRTLLDADATYDNVIDGFKHHLFYASEGDFVWFHFSGHGSEELTAEEFLPIEPNGKDQTLWCYDSGVDGVYNLADKELAVLINRIATVDRNGNPKPIPPQILVSLDCCHSGSGTRDAGEPEFVRTRNARSSGRKRPLDTYIGGYYSNQGSSIQVPIGPHALLSACQSYQRAGDLNDGGAFTSGLVRALKASNGQINYADLFIRTRASVRQIRKNQTPDFSAIDNFYPYNKFMSSDSIGDPESYEIYFESGKWYIKCGAIHGLPTNWNKSIEVEIRSFPRHVLLGKAVISSVGAQRSALDVSSSFSLKSTLKEILPGDDYYRGVIMMFPAPPVYVHVHGDTAGIKYLEDNWPDSGFYTSRPTLTPDCSVSVEVLENKLRITDLISLRHVRDQMFANDSSWSNISTDLFETLNKMTRWYRLKDLKNRSAKTKISDWVELQMNVYDTLGNIQQFVNDDITLYSNERNSRDFKLGFMPKVKVYNADQDLFFYLLYMQPNYAIDCPDGEIVYYASENTAKKELEIALWKEIKGFGPESGEPSVTSHFKLLVTTEKLDYFQFLQSGVGKYRSTLSTWAPDRISNDWLALDMSVTILKEKQLDPSYLCEAINEKVGIEGIDGQVCLAPAFTWSLKLSNEGNPLLLQTDGFELIDLSEAGNEKGVQTMEINGYKERSNQDFGIIELKEPVTENELLFPFVFDGTFFRIAGESVEEVNESRISLNRLPPVSTGGQTMNDYEGDRGLRSLKLTFFKLVLNDNKCNSLSRLISDEGELKLTRNGMATSVMSSGRILLVLHGIIGDGLDMCRDLSCDNSNYLNSYDVVLVYNYESLNTSLDDTAALLLEELNKLNLTAHPDKKVDIIAHCCGGLIARWLIEQLNGNQFIWHLTMIGTPNAGTLYQRVDQYRSFAMKSLELAANILPNLIPGTGLLIKLLKMANKLTPAIRQMSPDSDFLTQLNTSPDPDVEYSIVAGHAGEVDSNRADRLIRNIYGELSKCKSSNEPASHDLLVSIASVENKRIFEIRNPVPHYQSIIEAHHFNLNRFSIL